MQTMIASTHMLIRFSVRSPIGKTTLFCTELRTDGGACINAAVDFDTDRQLRERLIFSGLPLSIADGGTRPMEVSSGQLHSLGVKP